MIYITGDMHRDFGRLYNMHFSKDDMLIILGDAGINFYLNTMDVKLKEFLNKLNIKMFCIRGNHEERPENIDSYQEVELFGGKVFIEKEFPNLIFSKDGEIYNIDGNSILVIGGAYSIDKNTRIIHGYPWFKDEQLSQDEMNSIYKKVKGKHFDIVLTHTCPRKYEPTEAFLDFVDQSLVDKSMEDYLDIIEESITYDKWYCGHYHIEKKIDKIEFMYGGVDILKTKSKTKLKENN